MFKTTFAVLSGHPVQLTRFKQIYVRGGIKQQSHHLFFSVAFRYDRWANPTALAKSSSAGTRSISNRKTSPRFVHRAKRGIKINLTLDCCKPKNLGKCCYAALKPFWEIDKKRRSNCDVTMLISVASSLEISGRYMPIKSFASLQWKPWHPLNVYWRVQSRFILNTHIQRFRIQFHVKSCPDSSWDTNEFEQIAGKY